MSDIVIGKDELSTIYSATCGAMVPLANTKLESIAFGIAAGFAVAGDTQTAALVAFVPYTIVNAYCIGTGQFKRLIKRNAVLYAAAVMSGGILAFIDRK
jgi:hypothetical protein